MKWYSCLRDRYYNYFDMQKEIAVRAGDCHPHFYRDLMEQRINERIENLKDKGCYSGDKDSFCGQFTLCDDTKQYAGGDRK